MNPTGGVRVRFLVPALSETERVFRIGVRVHCVAQIGLDARLKSRTLGQVAQAARKAFDRAKREIASVAQVGERIGVNGGVCVRSHALRIPGYRLGGCKHDYKGE
jgi:hypothetical protein